LIFQDNLFQNGKADK